MRADREAAKDYMEQTLQKVVHLCLLL